VQIAPTIDLASASAIGISKLFRAQFRNQIGENVMTLEPHVIANDHFRRRTILLVEDEPFCGVRRQAAFWSHAVL